MRVALDLSPLVRPFPASVVRTVRPILRALEARSDVEIVGLAPREGPSLATWRQTALPHTARTKGAQVLHSFTSAFPLVSRLAVVQTVHEAPWKHGARENAGLAHRAWAWIGRRDAAATCVPSAGVARDLSRHPHLHVVPWGVDPAFGPTPDGSDVRLRTAFPDLPDGPFVLALGAMRPKKRLDLVCAGAELAGLPVVATGRDDVGSAELRARFDQLVTLGEIDEVHLPALVRAAGCVAILSTSEGFALPVLEALRTGRTVVARAGSVQAETAAGAAYEVDAEDPDDVARGLREAVAAPLERIERGREVAGRYSWASTAQRLVEVWGSLA